MRGERVEQVEERPEGGGAGSDGELGVQIGEGEGIVGAAGGREAALDGLRERVLVGEDGGGEAAREQPVREPQRAARIASPATRFGGEEAEDELLDEILCLVVVHRGGEGDGTGEVEC